MTAGRPIARKERVVVRQLDGETLVYDLGSHEAHCLNETAAAVWRRCDGQTTPAEIAADLGYDDEVVWLALDELWKLSLLEGEPAPERRMTLSRRRLLKTALVALPVAATIAVPPAAAVVTCGGPGDPCETTLQCCTGCTCISHMGVMTCGGCP